MDSPWRYGGAAGAVDGWSAPAGMGGGGYGGGFSTMPDNFMQTAPLNPQLGQINQVTALQRENDALRMQNQQLTSKSQQMEHALSMADARARQPNAEFQRRMTEMSRDCQRLHEEKEGLRRQLKQRETEVEATAAQHEAQIRSIRGYEDQLKAQIDQEKRVAADRAEQERAQHQRDLDLARKEKEQIQDDGRKRAADLEAQVAKLQLERDRDHDAMLDAQKNARTLETTISGLQEESRRKDDLMAMHEKESRVKQDRVDEALKLVAALQSNVTELETSGRKAGSDLDIRLRELETLRKDNAALLENLKAEQKNTDKWAKGYADVGALLAASEVEIRGVNLDSSASRLVKELEATKHKVTKLSHEIEEHKHAVEAQKLKVAQAERERDDANEAVLSKEDQVTGLQEDLLASTVELRDMLAKQDHLARDMALETQRRNDNESTVATKDKEIEKLLKEASSRQKEHQAEKAAWFKEKANLQDSARNQLAVINADHSSAISALEQSLALAGQEAQNQLEFSDMCRTMAELLEVNAKTSSAVLARTLYERVSQLLNNEADLKGQVLRLEEQLEDVQHELKEAKNHKIYVHEQPALPSTTPFESLQHHLHAGHSYDGDRVRQSYESPRNSDRGDLIGTLSRSQGYGASTGRSGRPATSVAESRLRDENKVLRSKMAQLQVSSDEFVSKVSLALGIKQKLGDKTSLDLLVERVRDLMADGAAALTASTKRDGYGKGRLGTSSGSRGAGHDSSTSIKQLQRKFRIAIRTIETLDKLIEKLKDDGDASFGNSTLLHQNHELQIELAELKHQLFTNSVGGVDVGTSNDHTSVDHVTHELDRYRRFVDDVCKEIGLRTMVNPDFGVILKRIQELRDGISRSGSSRPTSARISSARPPASPSMRRSTTTNRHLRAPFRP